MRLTRIMAALAAVLAFGLAAPKPADAGWKRGSSPAGWGKTRDVTHHIYYPRYRHIYKVHPHTDPHAYHYEPRGYYTKSSSRYWVSSHKMRHRHHRAHAHGHKFRYHRAWGHRHRHRHRRHRHRH